MNLSCFISHDQNYKDKVFPSNFKKERLFNEENKFFFDFPKN